MHHRSGEIASRLPLSYRTPVPARQIAAMRSAFPHSFGSVHDMPPLPHPQNLPLSFPRYSGTALTSYRHRSQSALSRCQVPLPLRIPSTACPLQVLSWYRLLPPAQYNDSLYWTIFSLPVLWHLPMRPGSRVPLQNKYQAPADLILCIALERYLTVLPYRAPCRKKKSHCWKYSRSLLPPVSSSVFFSMFLLSATVLLHRSLS